MKSLVKLLRTKSVQSGCSLKEGCKTFCNDAEQRTRWRLPFKLGDQKMLRASKKQCLSASGVEVRVLAPFARDGAVSIHADALCVVVHHFTAMRRDSDTLKKVAISLGKLRTALLPNFVASLIGCHVAIL